YPKAGRRSAGLLTGEGTRSLYRTYPKQTMLEIQIRVEESMMKAIVYTRYGPPDVLQFRESKKPEPADNQVLVKVHAASINPFDWHVMRGEPFPVRLVIGGLLAPKHTILGSDIAGRVEAVGKSIGRFRPGDKVFGG